jgi:hypothetical protein
MYIFSRVTRTHKIHIFLAASWFSEILVVLVDSSTLTTSVSVALH